MKITLLVIGKTAEKYLKEGVHEYENRIKHYLPFEIIELPAIKSSAKISFNKQKEMEADLLMKKIVKYDYIVLLDEKGEERESKDFAVFIEKQMNSGIKNLLFIVGGPYGFDEIIYAKATRKISLSKMTFSHQMIRLIFVEQLYRAMTIIRNEAYHHE